MDVLPRAAGNEGNRRPQAFDCFIAYGGRIFCAREQMARIFLRRARAIVASGRNELVPLPHKDGVDLLHVGPRTVFSVTFSRNAAGPETVDSSRMSGDPMSAVAAPQR